MSNLEPLIGGEAVDLPLDLEQRVDAAHDVQRDRRYHRRNLALRPRLAARRCLNVRHHEEGATGMAPTPRFEDRLRSSRRIVECAVAAVGIGLEEPLPTGEVRGRMGPGAIGRVVEHGRRRGTAAEGAVVADIGPYAPGRRFSLREHRDRRVVTVQPLGGKDVSFQAPEQRHEHVGRRANVIRQRRQAEVDPFAGIALALSVQG